MSDFAAELRARLADVDVLAPATAAAEAEVIGEATAITGREIDEDDLEAADSLEYFACAYAGTDHLPLATLEQRGVAVSNAAGVHAPNVAEHAIGSILAFDRGLFLARERQERREWRSYPVRDLHGARVAVVGMGAIGRAVVERLDAFGAESVGVRYTPEKGGPAETVYGFDETETAVAGADAVVLACRLTDATRGLIDDGALRVMSTDATLINVARGPVVHTDALVAALQRNAIGGVALDVTDPEPLPPDHQLWSFENVLVTPHVAGNTPAYFERLADIVAPNVRTVATGGDCESLRNRVI
jgi:phosphoglycerate dehydrogenase-like enzyme